jgi:hypothetical protein
MLKLIITSKVSANTVAIFVFIGGMREFVCGGCFESNGNHLGLAQSGKKALRPLFYTRYKTCKKLFKP